MQEDAVAIPETRISYELEENVSTHPLLADPNSEEVLSTNWRPNEMTLWKKWDDPVKKCEKVKAIFLVKALPPLLWLANLSSTSRQLSHRLRNARVRVLIGAKLRWLWYTSQTSATFW